MKRLNVLGHVIRADKIIGFSDLKTLTVACSNCGWQWGLKIYSDIEITVYFGYGENSSKEKATKQKNALVKEWEEYLKDIDEI